MGFPFPSFGAFLFLKEETALFGTNIGWIPSPSYVRDKILGANTDNIITATNGSDERTFEVYLTPDRYAELLALMNTRATFTDWTRPTPDSRLAFLMLVTPLEWPISFDPQGATSRKVRTRLTLVSQ